MKLAIIGSRQINLKDIEKYLPPSVSEIVSGGAKGVDSYAAEYARKNGIKLTEFLPEYEKYGRGAPLKRNVKIVEYADEGLAFWDVSSKGTKYTIELFKKANKKIAVIHAARFGNCITVFLLKM